MFDFDNQLSNMVRCGQIFARKDYNKFRTKPIAGEYLSLEEWLEAAHRGNQLDRMNGLIKNTKLKTVKYSDHVARLLSGEDTTELELPTFFDGSAFNNTIAYTSYSRSGNTFFRRYLEQVGSIFTGSDGDLNYGLHFGL